jgi:hypothetical protein
VVDLLFVVDSSPSMDKERCKIADRIPEFVSRLAPDTDYRIAVMLAHGGASYWSGRLYTGWRGGPAVLGSDHLSVHQIQKALRERLEEAGNEIDHDEANGEAGMYSVMEAVKPERLRQSQKQGFFRPDAALSIVFVTDENDLCYRPELNGYRAFPDYVKSRGGLEEVAYDRYCGLAGHNPASYPNHLYSRLVTFKGDRPVTLGGIVHTDPRKVPHGGTLEDAIGHGIIELTQKSANGVLIDIASDDYAAGLTQLGDVVQTTLNVLTRFGLDGQDEIDPSSVLVDVDGRAVGSVFDAESRSVEIPMASAGHGGSVVDVWGCRMPAPEPSPDPSSSATPSPTPSDTPSPDPSSTATPSPTVTPSPTATPSSTPSPTPTPSPSWTPPPS